MTNQALFSSKDKSKKLKCRLLQFLFGALWVKLPLQGRQQMKREHSNFTTVVFPYAGII